MMNVYGELTGTLSALKGLTGTLTIPKGRGFSAFEITVADNNEDEWFTLRCWNAGSGSPPDYDSNCVGYKDEMFYSALRPLNGQPTTYNLYHTGNSATLYLEGYCNIHEMSGDVVREGSTLIITGDCSIVGYVDY